MATENIEFTVRISSTKSSWVVRSPSGQPVNIDNSAKVKVVGALRQKCMGGDCPFFNNGCFGALRVSDVGTVLGSDNSPIRQANCALENEEFCADVLVGSVTFEE